MEETEFLYKKFQKWKVKWEFSADKEQKLPDSWLFL